jgi:peptidyl-prolyl cis-trans isomerase C
MSVVNQFNPNARAMLVSVNGVEIPEAAIAAEMEVDGDNAEAPDRVKSWEQAATALVLRELLLQESAEQGIEGDDEARIEALLSRHIHVPVADDTHCRRFFDENPGRFRSPDLVEARHILLAAPPFDEEAREQARFEARRLIEELQGDPLRFDELANTYSACPSREQGGRLGQLSSGATVPEFENALFALETGLASAPLETRYGLHVVWVDHKIAGEPLPYDHVKLAISRFLEDSVFRKSVSQYLQVLAGKARITGVDIKAAESPLLQ